MHCHVGSVDQISTLLAEKGEGSYFVDCASTPVVFVVRLLPGDSAGDDLCAALQLLYASVRTRGDISVLVQSLRRDFLGGERRHSTRNENTRRLNETLGGSFVAACEDLELARQLYESQNEALIAAPGVRCTVHPVSVQQRIEHSPSPDLPGLTRNLIRTWGYYRQNIQPRLSVRVRTYINNLTSLVKQLLNTGAPAKTLDFRLREWEPNVRLVPAENIPESTDNRICLLFCLHWLELGGAEKFAFDLVRRLDRSRYRVVLAADNSARSNWGEQVAQYVDEIIPLYDYATSASAQGFMDYLVRSRGVNLVHLHHSDIGYESLPLLRSLHPQLYMMDSLHIIENGTSAGYPEVSGARFSTYLDCHHVISRHLFSYMSQRFLVPESRLQLGYLIEPGVNAVEPAAAGDFRQQFAIPEDAFLVAFVGRLVKQKQPETFIDMCAQLQDRIGGEHKLHYAMVGDGRLRTVCDKRIAGRGLASSLVITGTMPEVSSAYAAADLLVMPSDNEGLALVTYEAAAAGVPILFTDVGAQRELSSPDSLVSPDGDVAGALADRIVALLADPIRLQDMVDTARENLSRLSRESNGFTVCEEIYGAVAGGD